MPLCITRIQGRCGFFYFRTFFVSAIRVKIDWILFVMDIQEQNEEKMSEGSLIGCQ